MKNQTYYVTTPIYYGTAKPHLGSLYSTLIADVLNRWEKLKGSETYFLTGTDEHGQKIAQAAQKEGKSPQEFVDSFIAAYKETWKTYGIEYSQFIRTTDAVHKKGVQALVAQLIAQGDIYKSEYAGWYCTPCETFVTAEKEGVAPECLSCQRETHKVTEESYFFKLSAYEQKILDFYKNNPNFIDPKERLNEVIRFVEGGLEDLSISRTTVSWGVPFPNDSEHVVYVWVDALCNYITAIGYGDSDRKKEFEKWWPAQMQVLGKDIVRFHAVYWPALLMAADLALPKKLLVHGWIQIDKQKMSKSRGNVVDPMELAKKYGAESVRYYLMRQIPVNADGEFSIADLEQRITSDLANDLGNLLNRMVSLAHRYEKQDITPPKIWQKAALDLRDDAITMIEEFELHMSQSELHLALARLWKFINKTNAYFHAQEPWKIAKNDEALFTEVIAATCHSLRSIAVLLWPIMPNKMIELLKSIGQTLTVGDHTLDSLEIGDWRHEFSLKKIDPLFEKIDMEKEEKKSEEKSEKNVEAPDYITIDDVIKVELRAGTITSAESVPDSEKLIKMQVDFGEHGTRQIFAGMRKWYHPEDFVGKQGVFVFNLKPRKMLGEESQGMMLAANGEDGKPRPALFDGLVPNGTRLK